MKRSDTGIFVTITDMLEDYEQLSSGLISSPATQAAIRLRSLLVAETGFIVTQRAVEESEAIRPNRPVVPEVVAALRPA